MCSGKKTFPISEIAGVAGAEVIGDGSLDVCGVNSLGEACQGEISFVSKAKMKSKALESKASALISASKVEGFDGFQLIVENVDAALIAVLNLFAVEVAAEPGIHPSAVVDASAEIGDNVSIGPCACIGRNVSIGDGSEIASGCSIGDNVVIGKNCRIDSSVVIYRNCVIGNNCVIQANTTIGACGFGYSLIDGQHKLVPHNGGVIIEDCVEIGANSTVDRAKFGNTIIGAGTKIDNFVMVAHNVIIGRCCLLAGRSAIAGSSVLGDGVVLAGDGGVGDNCTLGDGVVVTTRATALNDIPAGMTVSGTPGRDMKDHMRQLVHVHRLPKMAKQMKELVKRVQDLEASKNN
ncbi:MAG: UDP-3-O-(3-hydroxymyristoyl)glucosamine N-acyltransferase [Planctomycetes bacterium]|nr:UDP-3-O-(3-hydroxymyristoyl)glucosamine N-acyltransferase [Planctomycetota bacterium]